MTNSIIDFLWSVAIKKGISRGVQLIAAYLASSELSKLGITINVEQMTLAVFAGLEVARSYVKQKWGVKWL